MTQPPPPPGNPPNFGKPGGAEPPPPPQGPPPSPPQGPPPGAPGQPQYGYPQPQQPPPQAPWHPQAAQPAYGYPQAPAPPTPAAPVEGNPYAQPVPPGQNPYAQGQPSYGHPQAPPPYGAQPYGAQPPYQGGPAAPGAGGGGGSNGKLVGIIAAVVALVLAIGGGVWFVTRDGGDNKPDAKGGSSGSGDDKGGAEHSINGRLLWKKPVEPIKPDDNLVDVPQIWFTDKDVIKTTPSSVTAWNLDTGAQHWTVPIVNKSCLASTNALDNKIVVSTGETCNQLMAIDLTTGKQLWTQTLKSQRGGKFEFDSLQIALAGDTVAASWLYGSATFKLSTGAPGWGMQPGARCKDHGFAGGKHLLDVLECGFQDGAAIQELDPANGNARWTWQAPAGTEIRYVLSTDPVVVGIKAGDGLLTDLVTIEGGKMVTKISLGVSRDNRKYDIDCQATEVMPCSRFAVSQDTLYLTTGVHKGGGGDFAMVSEVTAIDLKTGLQKWVSKGGEQRETVAMAYENGKVFAYQPAVLSKPGKVVTIDPATGRITPYTSLPKASSEDEQSAYGLSHRGLAWYADHLVLFNATVYSRNSGLAVAVFR